LRVIINSSGQLGTIQSSARFKDNIKPMDKTSEAILKLEPVTSTTSTNLILIVFRSSD
jgi:hypothetical protein